MKIVFLIGKMPKAGDQVTFFCKMLSHYIMKIVIIKLLAMFTTMNEGHPIGGSCLLLLHCDCDFGDDQ